MNSYLWAGVASRRNICECELCVGVGRAWSCIYGRGVSIFERFRRRRWVPGKLWVDKDGAFAKESLRVGGRGRIMVQRLSEYLGRVLVRVSSNPSCRKGSEIFCARRQSSKYLTWLKNKENKYKCVTPAPELKHTYLLIARYRTLSSISRSK